MGIIFLVIGTIVTFLLFGISLYIFFSGYYMTIDYPVISSILILGFVSLLGILIFKIIGNHIENQLKFLKGEILD